MKTDVGAAPCPKCISQGRVVQRLVKFNPGLNKNYGSICSKEKITVLIKYCLDFPRKKLVNNKFTDQIRL